MSKNESLPLEGKPLKNLSLLSHEHSKSVENWRKKLGSKNRKRRVLADGNINRVISNIC